MKFLQTSDWHLGKIFYETSLIQDQVHFLNQIIDELKLSQKNNAPYDALLIPGDIYDRSVPPSDAVNILNDFFTTIHKEFPKLHIFITSGNHDSPERLNFCAKILSDSNIHICATTKEFTTPFILQTESEKAAIYQLPFLTPYSIEKTDKENNDAQNEFDFSNNARLKFQQELYEEACKQIKKDVENHADCISIFCGHLFTLNSTVSDSERSNIGTADQVDASLFDFFDYGAIGHIHSFQKAGKKNLYYSGSPLAYSFDDSKDKFLLSVTICKNQPAEITKIPVEPLHKVTRLEGSFSDFYGPTSKIELIQTHKNDFIEIICTDEVLPSSPMPLLKTVFPNVLSFKMKSFFAENSNQMIAERRKIIEGNSLNKSENLFEAFFDEINQNAQIDQNLKEEEKKIFLNYAKGIL